MKGIVVIGASGHGKVIADIFLTSGEYQVIGFLDDDERKHGQSLLGVEVLGNIKHVLALRNSIIGGIIGIGHNNKRQEVVTRLTSLAPWFTFVSAIHPTAKIGQEVTIGDGTTIMAGAVINTSAKVGHHCIINTGACVDHDCVLGDYASIAPHAALGGNVEVCETAAIGINACVIQGVRISKGAIVGAGAAVIRDVAAHHTVVGVPAKSKLGGK